MEQHTRKQQSQTEGYHFFASCSASLKLRNYCFNFLRNVRIPNNAGYMHLLIAGILFFILSEPDARMLHGQGN